MTIRRTLLIAGWAVILGRYVIAEETSVPSADLADPLQQLVIDDRFIDERDNVALVLGQVEKHAANPLFQADQPWENSLNNLYPNVVYDPAEKLFKLWYKCTLPDKEAIAKLAPPNTIHDVGWLLLYASSADGVKWERPALKQVTFAGSATNNAVARDTPNAGVFRDTNLACPTDRLFKMVYDTGLGQVKVRFSPDGIRWGEPFETKGLTARTGDTHNNAFWDSQKKRYVLLTRFVLGERLVARSESDDFVTWDPPTLALRSTLAEGKSRQTYCLPAFAYGNGYFGFAMMYNVAGDKAVDCELAWSPDAVRWQRLAPGTAFIPRGPDGTYDSQCIYAQANPPVLKDGKLHIYYGGDDYPHIGWKRHCLPCLATLKPDRFAGYRPALEDQPGILLTHPVRVMGDAVRVSADATGGELRITAIDEAGMVVGKADVVKHDVTDEPLIWPSDVARKLAGKIVRLKVETERATVYAISGVELLPAPTFKPDVRRFEKTLSVEVTSLLPGKPRYTLDGSDPTSKSPEYLGPLVIEADTTVKTRQFFPSGAGPIATAQFVSRKPWGERHPDLPPTVVAHRASFDDDTAGWLGMDKIEHIAQGGARGGFVRLSREAHQPYLMAEAKSSTGVFIGNLPARFGGDGLRLAFQQRAEHPASVTRVELFAKDIAQWSYDKGPPATQDWAEANLTIRWNWSDVEAQANGWRPAVNAFSWRETVENVGRVVIAPLVAAEAHSFDIDEVSATTSFDER